MSEDSVRRIVSGQSPHQRARISSAGPAPVFTLPTGMRIFEIWKSGKTPAVLTSGSEEPAAGPLSLEPPDGGTLFRIVDFPPDTKEHDDPEAVRAVFEQMGAGRASTSSTEAKGVLMHRTETLDYGIVLEGEITLVVDEGEVSLKAGDTVVQRGANHGWMNRSGRPCRMAFVLIAGQYSR